MANESSESGTGGETATADAKQKRQALITALEGWIKDTKTLITTDSKDTKTLLLNLAQVNDTLEEFKKAHMDYVALVNDLGDKATLRDEYDEIMQDVEDTRTGVQSCIDAVDKAKEKVDGETGSNKGDDISDNESIASIKSAKIKAATKRATLEVKAKMLRKKQEIELKEQQLKQQKDMLDLESELEIAKAEEEAIIVESEGSVSSKSDKTSSSDKEISFKLVEVSPTTESIQYSKADS